MKVAVSVPSYQVTSPATCPWLGTRLDYTPHCRHLPLERERGVTSSAFKLLYQYRLEGIGNLSGLQIILYYVTLLQYGL